LQKLASDIGSRQASPVEAGGAHGDLAQRKKTAKKRPPRAKGVEKIPTVQAPEDPKGRRTTTYWWKAFVVVESVAIHEAASEAASAGR